LLIGGRRLSVSLLDRGLVVTGAFNAVNINRGMASTAWPLDVRVDDDFGARLRGVSFQAGDISRIFTAACADHGRVVDGGVLFAELFRRA
jgi:hypothetical protein